MGLGELIYVLRLEKDRYYIGRTSGNPLDDLRLHLEGRLSSWTRRYKAEAIIDVQQGDRWSQLKVAWSYLRVYGIDKVCSSEGL